MQTQHARPCSRRKFLRAVTLAGTADLLGLPPTPVAAEPPPETTRLRLVRVPGICVAAEYVAEALLQGEGFTEVHYVEKEGSAAKQTALAFGEVDLTLQFSGPLLLQMDRGDLVVILAGVHVGCWELFGTERVRTIRDLKGKTIAIAEVRSSHHVFLSSVVAYVGLDPQKDITWVTHHPEKAMQLFAEEKIDAFMAFPPQTQELRAKQIGHVVVNSSVDRPWSQYFCCMVAGDREFVRKYPVATKRAVRALLKAADVCTTEPAQAAQFLVEKGFTRRYDHALQAIKEIPYNQWREYSAEDTLRFYALRLHEVGMLKSTPQKLLAQGTDWQFFNELKKELKG